jgi:hypothetical protein
MKTTEILRALLVMILASGSSVQAGPFPPAAGQSGSTAIPFNDPSIVAWASRVVELNRGPRNIANPSLGLASFGTGSNALGPASTDTTAVVSLGDGGSITLAFDPPIRNGLGFDLAVFENGFADNFIELAFVEVSSNGIDFFRFPPTSLTQTSTQIDAFGSIEPSNVNGLAGNYRIGFGTPFDLADLAGVSPALDLQNVGFVRMVDVVGSISSTWGTLDRFGNIIHDPYPTAFASGGFDLDGVAAFHVVPEVHSGMLTLVAGSLGLGLILLRRRCSL